MRETRSTDEGGYAKVLVGRGKLWDSDGGRGITWK